MNRMKVQLDFSYEQGVEIEEFCLNQGFSYTNYFWGLHQKNKSSIEQQKAVDEAVAKVTRDFNESQEPQKANKFEKKKKN